MADEFGDNGALRIDMGPVVLTEQQASEKALRTGTTNLRVEDGAYVADDPEYGPSILGQVAVEAPVLSPEDQRRIAIENQIKDVGYGLAQGVMVGAQNINRLVPGLPQLLDRVDSGMRSIGFPDTRMRAPESLAGALASGFGQVIPGIIPGVAALRAAGYGKFAADVLGGLIGDFVTSSKEDAEGIADLIGALEPEDADGVANALREFIQDDNATFEDLKSRLVMAVPGGILTGAFGILARAAMKLKNLGAIQLMARRLAKAPTTPAYRGEAQEIVGDLQVGHPGRKDSGWLGEGLSSTNSPRLASMYSLMKAPFGGAERAPNVMPVNLSLKNPLVITYDQKQTLRFMQPEARQNWLNENVITKGHDGVTVRFPQREYEGGPFVEEYMVLDPSQIRSRFDVPEGPVRSFLSSLKGKL